ncbi:MAG: formylglycine-generating enzyme family protein [Hyphomicrobiales bacterium]|nr:MAG: formylglycine-generating enzyme family protein [Hyphomicrobiales bacterium]
MVVVPAGVFRMGSDEKDDEKPIHTVTIAAPLAVGRFTITFDEWDGCVAHGGCPARGVAGANFGRGRQPVINVSWNDAQLYVKWISKLTGRTYRLLTEAEWEYVARAGTETQYSFGDDESALEDYAWFSDNSEGHAHPVGEKKPNPFDLYDMHGNVWQWVQDCYVKSYQDAPANGRAVPDKENCFRVLRGSSWDGRAVSLRSARRSGNRPGLRSINVGFRLARTLNP